jgi:hypothetical protein
LPWRYDAVPPTGEELAVSQAKKKAQKEQMEKMAAAEAKAEQTQMNRFMDEIIGDGKQFDGVSINPATSRNRSGRITRSMPARPEIFNAAAVKDNSAVPWGY